MASFVGTLLLVIIILTAGCSADTAKRTAYETLQNVHEQECLKNLASDCEKRESYDDYQRKRKELEPSK
jgi:hypothetical protein